MLYVEEIKITGRSGPVRMLNIAVKFKTEGTNTFVPWLACELKIENQLLVPPIQFSSFPMFLERQGGFWSSQEFAIPNESLQFIEKNRAKTGDVHLNAEVKFRYENFDLSKTDKPALEKFLNTFSSTGYTSRDHTIVIPRSDWLRQLTHLGWSNVQLFEIDVRPLQQDKNLDASIKCLQQATVLFREGEYDSTLSACVQAFAKASAVQIADTPLRGFEAILFRCFRDEQKRTEIKTLLETTQRLCSLGAKEQYPRLPFNRTEVEYCLKATLAAFELLSRKLAEGSSLDIT